MIPRRTPVLFVLAACAGVAAILLAAPVQAQSGGISTRAVVGGGVSFAGDGPETSGGAGLAGHAGVRHQRGPYVFSARISMNGGGASPSTTPGVLIDRFDEVALMAGYAVHTTAKALVVVSSGLAMVSGERVRTDEGTAAVPFGTRIGVPIQVALSGPGSRSGPGLVVHLNLNPEEMFGAVTFTYQLGSGS